VIAMPKPSSKYSAEHGSFDRIIWSFDDSEAMSRALKQRGFKFVGRDICYAFMQAAGIVDDHSPQCSGGAR